MSNYIPDRGFMQKLKELDPYLTAKWDDHKERWCIFLKTERFGYAFEWNGMKIRQLQKVEIVVKVVQGTGGEFRPLDDRTIRELKWGDLHNRDIDEVIEEFETQEYREKKSKRSKFRDECESIAKDNWRRAMGHPMVGYTPEVK